MLKILELPEETRRLFFFMVGNRHSLNHADALVSAAVEATGLSVSETKKLLLELYQIIFDQYLEEIKKA